MTMLEHVSFTSRETEPAHQEGEQNYEAIHKRLIAELGACGVANYQPLPRELSPEEQNKMREEIELIDSTHWREHVKRKYGQQTESEAPYPPDVDY